MPSGSVMLSDRVARILRKPWTAVPTRLNPTQSILQGAGPQELWRHVPYGTSPVSPGTLRIAAGCSGKRRTTMTSISDRGVGHHDTRPLIDHVAADWGNALWLLGRVLIGGIFVQSGLAKLMDLGGFAAM